MKITLQKENFLNSIKAVKGIVNARSTQPVLSAILFNCTEENKITLTTTDLNLSMAYTIDAASDETGKIAISAKVIEEIVTKLPDGKDITIQSEKDSNLIKIQSGKTKYEIVSFNSEEFPNVFNQAKKPTEAEIEIQEFEINAKDFNQAIKQTAFAAVQNNVGGVLSGISFIIKENVLEMVATDGNRLTRSRIPINSKSEEAAFICTYRTLMEISKLISLIPDKTIKFVIKGSKILFEFKDIIFQASLIDGKYPRYTQLVPETNEKIGIIDREKLINVIDRISVMANNRTNIMKFNFENSSLEISTDSPDAGSAKEGVDIEYTSEDMLIAFNYKYVLDVLRNISNQKIRVEMSTNLAATLFKPEKDAEDVPDGSYLCLIMPVQVR